MIIQTSAAKINVELFPSKTKEAAFVFLLHGFTGSSNDWKEIISLLSNKFSYAAIDLIGHGKSESPKEVKLYSADSIVQQLNEMFTHFTNDKFILISYSMGGRAALSYAVKYSSKLSALILESASAGIVDEKLRQERIHSDAQIIKMIEDKSIDEFIDYWLNQDLFATLNNLPKEKFERIKNSKLKIHKLGVINSLKGFGTGVMPPLYNKLHLVKCKTLLITGELDTKFTQINFNFVNSFPSAKHVVVQNAGHNVHLEKPEEFVEFVNEFLEST